MIGRSDFPAILDARLSMIIKKMPRREPKTKISINETDRTRLPGESEEKIPKSFVLLTGNRIASLQSLMKDVRRMLEPNTASKLKVRKSNKLKDFVVVAGNLGVTHMLLLHKTKTSSNVNLRILRTPHGPTLYFRVQSYTLSKDVLASQSHPKVSGSEFRVAPLLVLHNFEASSSTDSKDNKSYESMKFKLLTSLFRNMFPSIHVDEMKVSNARRVVLFYYNSEKQTIDLRHYAILMQDVGVSKPIKRLIDLKTPNLSQFSDISDFIAKDFAASDSEFEDNEDNQVLISKEQQHKKRKTTSNSSQNPINDRTGSTNHPTSRKSIKLVELGPRLELKLIKIEKDLCQGEVLYHSFIKKTAEEVQKLKESREMKDKTKESRKRKQEENVKRKELDKELHRKITSEGGRKGIHNRKTDQTSEVDNPTRTIGTNSEKFLTKKSTVTESVQNKHSPSGIDGSSLKGSRKLVPLGKVFRVRTKKTTPS